MRSADDRSEPPAQADKEEPAISEKLRLTFFKKMSDELKYPADYEQLDDHTPHCELDQDSRDQNDRRHYHRNADDVCDLIDRVAMSQRILIDPFVPCASAHHSHTR